MDPTATCCPNLACPARGQRGQGNMRIHSRKDERFICTECRKTFAETTGTVFYRLRTPAETLTLVITLLAHGYPLQAIGVAFGLERQMGCAPSALRGVLHTWETVLLETAGAWEKDACAEEDVREILGAVDETFLEQMMLVFMDLCMGYLLLEEVAEDRTYATWKAVVDARLLALGPVCGLWSVTGPRR